MPRPGNMIRKPQRLCGNPRWLPGLALPGSGGEDNSGRRQGDCAWPGESRSDTPTLTKEAGKPGVFGTEGKMV